MRNPRRTLRFFAAAALICLPMVGVPLAGDGSAAAAGLPLSHTCAGTWWAMQDVPTGTTVLTAELSCTDETVWFDGSTASAFHPCPGDGATTVTFQGTQNTGTGTPDVAATWILRGASGLFGVTASVATGEKWVGALEDVGGTASCLTSSGGEAALVSSPQSTPAPDLLACRAAGTVGPNVQNGGRSGYSFSGTASGSGTCESAQGPWSLSYTGDWSESGVWGQAPNCPGAYQVTIDVTNPSSGASMSSLQNWDPSGPDNPHPTTVGTPGVEPLGAGVISQSPDACTLPATMSTSTDWIFAISG